MKRTAIALIPILLTVLACCSNIKLAQAGSISVGTYDASGLPRDVFAEGEVVRIKAVSSNKPITITVTDQNNVIVYTEIYNGYEYDKTLNNITKASGWYTVEAKSSIDSIRKNYACTYFFVAPENPLGTLGTILAVFLGLGLYRFVTHK